MRLVRPLWARTADEQSFWWYLKRTSYPIKVQRQYLLYRGPVRHLPQFKSKKKQRFVVLHTGEMGKRGGGRGSVLIHSDTGNLRSPLTPTKDAKISFWIPNPSEAVSPILASHSNVQFKLCSTGIRSYFATASNRTNLHAPVCFVIFFFNFWNYCTGLSLGTVLKVTTGNVWVRRAEHFRVKKMRAQTFSQNTRWRQSRCRAHSSCFANSSRANSQFTFAHLRTSFF